MKDFLIVLGVILGLYLIYIILKPIIIKKRIISGILKDASKYEVRCTILKNHVDNADFSIKTDDKVFLVKVINVKKNCDLQINNIDTFMMYTKTLSKTFKVKKIPNLTKFMKSKKGNRIIILSTKAKTIKKVINECEMVMVDENTDVYGVHILNYNNYSYLFKK